MKKKIFVSLLIVIANLKISSQCLQIESILVDACDGGNEGRNEMVTFSVGSSPLNLSTIVGIWPAKLDAVASCSASIGNAWLGVCQNTLTAAIISQINSSITACGLLVEPVGGVLPANCKVLFITSTAMNPNAQSFANLSETLTVIFQCPGNTSGHFANYSTSNSTCVPTQMRTFSLSFGAGCSDIVAYDKSQLLNQALVIGAQDGGAVNFNAAGVPTYVNYGCAVPVNPLTINATINNNACTGIAQNITSTVTGGTFNNILWTGGTGTFASTTTTNTSNTYTPGSGDAGIITLSATVSRTCTGGGSTASTIYTFAIIQTPTLGLNTNTFSICGTQSANIVASSQAGNTYSWSTLATTNSISVSPASTTIYTVTAINTCSTISTTATVTPGAANSITISASSNALCAGNSAILTATSSAGTYSWNTGATTNSIVVSPTSTTNYSVTSNGCTTVSAFQTITVTPAPNLTINTNSFNICGSQTATIVANSSVGSYTWSNGANTSSIVVSSGGVYTVTSANTCSSVSQTATVTTGTAPAFTITPSTAVICAGLTASLSAGAISLTYSLSWSGPGIVGASNFNNVTINLGGTYTLTATDAVTGCSSNSLVTVVSGSTNAYFTPDVTTGNPPLNVNFNNQSTGANTYSWTLGNGSSNTSTNTTTTYNNAGTYIVTLFASANGQCASQYTVEIIVKDGLGLIPELVTANGDTKNDFFEIKGLYENYPKNRLDIFNRWGGLVYSSEPYKNDWNGIPNASGKTGSNKLPSGTYYFILQLNDANLTVYKGYLQLEY